MALRLLGSLSAGQGEWLSSRLGALFFRLDKIHRNIALDNLTHALGNCKTDEQIRTLARQVFINILKNVFEISRVWRWSDDQLARQITIYGLEDIQHAVDNGKGVILLGAHFGNWELLPVVAHMAGLQVGIVYRTLDSPALDRLLHNIRSRHGSKLISNERGAMRKIYKDIRNGQCVGLLMDQGMDYDSGVFVDFFHRPAATNTGMALLALKSKAPVVPLFLIRRPNGFQAIFGPELPLIQTGDRTRDIEENTQLYTQVIEAYVRRFPDQWFWVHQRWKNLPFCPWPRTNPRVSNRY